MKRRQKIRNAIVVLAGLFVLYVAVSIRPSGARPKEVAGQVADTLAAEAVGIRDRLRFRDFVYDENRGDGGSYRIRASEALGFSTGGDEVFRLKDVRFETPEQGGRVGLSLRAPRAEFQQGTKALRVYEGVTMEGETASLRGASFRFDPARREFSSEGPVTMVRGRVVATAEKGILETEGGRVRLEGKVRMAGIAEEGRFLRLAAPSVILERNGAALAAGGVNVETADAILRSESVERLPEGGGDRLRTTGETTILLRSSPSGAPILASGDAADLARDADGFPVALTLSRKGSDARIVFAPSGRAGARRALAPRFEASFVAGKLSSVGTPQGLHGAEAVPSEGRGGTGFRTLESGWARFSFLPGGKDLDVAVFDRAVTISDGTGGMLRAAKGTIRGADEVAVFSGDGTLPAEYRDEEKVVRAQLLTWLRRESRVEASGDVRATLRSGAAGVFPGGAEGGPIYSESDTLSMQTAARVVTLAGHVRAWRKENVLRSSKLVLDDAARAVRAEGNVRAVFRRRLLGSPSRGLPAKVGSETITATGDVLTYREADRNVRIEGSSTMVSGPWSMTATVTDIRLTKEKAIESAEARGTVVLEDRATSRHGEGSRATWKPETDTVALEGAPAVAIDGKGNRMSGARLTFRQGRSRVDIESGPGVVSEGTFKPEGS